MITGEYINHEFEPGVYSFYGAIKFSVTQGSPICNGALLKQGIEYTLYSPFHHNPIVFESEAPFALSLISIPLDQLNEIEKEFYIPSPNKKEFLLQTFEEISELAYFSSKYIGINIPEEILALQKSITPNDRVSIILLGPQGSGKSTLSKYISNFLFSQRPLVFIDLDPGQPESGLPGAISWNIIGLPLLSTSEHHPPGTFTEKHIYPLGGIGFESKYKWLFISILNKIASSIPSDANVVINTSGFITGPGIELQKSTISILKPTHIFFLQSGPNPIPIDFKQVNLKTVHPNPFKNAQRPILRILRFISYFPHLANVSIFEMSPLQLQLNKVIFFINDQPNQCGLAAINGNIVSLCTFLPEKRPDPNILSSPKIKFLRNLPLLEQIAIGIVKSINIKENIMKIVSPISQELLDTIDVVVYQNINFPMEMISSLNRASLPYAQIFPFPKINFSNVNISPIVSETNPPMVETVSN